MENQIHMQTTTVLFLNHNVLVSDDLTDKTHPLTRVYG